MLSSKHRRQSAERPARIARAYELRVQGFTEREIAKELGCSPPAAHSYLTEAFSKAMEEIHERGRHYIGVEFDRLEMAAKHLRRGLLRGDPNAIREWRSLSESRRKLLGLDAKPDFDADAREVRVTLSFAPVAHGHPPGDVEGGEQDDRRSTSIPVDRDGNEDR